MPNRETAWTCKSTAVDGHTKEKNNQYTFARLIKRQIIIEIYDLLGVRGCICKLNNFFMLNWILIQSLQFMKQFFLMFVSIYKRESRSGQ